MIQSHTIEKLPEWFANVVDGWRVQESINGHPVKLSAYGGSAAINVVVLSENKYLYISDAALPVGDERSFRLLLCSTSHDTDNVDATVQDRKKSGGGGGGKDKTRTGGGSGGGSNKRKGVQYDVLQARIFEYLEEYEPVNACGDILTLDSIIKAVTMDDDEGIVNTALASKAVEKWFGYHPTRGGGQELSRPNTWKIIGKQ
jgi:hypothetical protein